MPFAVSRRATLRCLTVSLAMISGPAFGAEVVPEGAGVPRFNHAKQETCAQRAHERVKAVMEGTPWPRPDGRPVASNRHCG
jgi:hypothetical protein